MPKLSSSIGKRREAKWANIEAVSAKATKI
jgi:hypothetical protein